MPRSARSVRRSTTRAHGVNPLPNPQPKSAMTDTEVATYLTTLYKSTVFAPYGCYFYLNNMTASDFLSCTGPAMETPDQIYQYNKYAADLPTHFGLNVQFISALGGTTGSKAFAKAGLPWQVFVKLDNYTQSPVLLPFQTACALSLTFIKGLVTRLILEKYNDLWSSIRPPISVPSLPLVPPSSPPPPAPPPLTVLSWATTYVTSLSVELTTVANWTKWPVQDYSQCLSNMTDASLQVAGLATGWSAADALISAADNTSIQAIWNLLNRRYTTQHLGAMVGYTFCYMSGYLKNERIAALMQGVTPPAQIAGPAELPTIYTNLAQNIDTTSTSGSYAQPTFDITNRFFALVVGEFFSITQNTSYAPPPPSTSATDALASYQAFITGFETGMSQGADVLFTDLYTEGWEAGEQFGYSIGYSNGYRDGYSQGYAAGWQAGYSAMPAATSTWMSGLNNIFGGLGNLLDDAGQLPGILSDVGTVGQAIASIFSL